jgi:hypothetical protein
MVLNSYAFFFSVKQDNHASNIGKFKREVTLGRRVRAELGNLEYDHWRNRITSMYIGARELVFLQKRTI